MCWLITQMVATAKLDEHRARSRELPLALPGAEQGPSSWSAWAAFPGIYQGAGTGVGQLRLEPVLRYGMAVLLALVPCPVRLAAPGPLAVWLNPAALVLLLTQEVQDFCPS